MEVNFQTPAHFGLVREIIFDPSHLYLISLGEDDGCIYVWNSSDLTRSTNTDLETNTKDSSVRAIWFRDKNKFIFGGENQKITQIDWPKCSNYNTVFESTKNIDFAADNLNLQNIVIVCGKQIFIIDSNFSVTQDFEIENEIIWIQYSPDGNYLAAADNMNNIIIWNVNDYSVTYKNSYKFSSAKPFWDQKSTLFVPDTTTPGRFDVLNPEIQSNSVLQINDQKDSTTCALLSNDSRLIIADKSHQITIYQLNSDLTAEPIQSFSFDGEDISALGVTGNLIGGGDSDGNVYLWGISETEEPEIILEEPETPQVVPDPVKEDPQSVFTILKDNPYHVKSARKTIKSTKNKGKQQTLKLPTIKSTPKTTKRQFLPEEDSESSFSEDVIADTPIESNLIDTNDQSFLDEDDDEDNGEQIVKNNEQSFLDEDDDDDNDEASDHSAIHIPSNDDIDIPSDESLNETHEELSDNSNDKFDDETIIEVSKQFMPGSSTEYYGTSRILCWNGYGSVIIKQDEQGTEHIDITPSETSDFYAKRIDNIIGPIAATIDDYGYCIATRNHVLYHRHGTYGPNSDVTLNFPFLEPVELVAIGSTWFAVTTSFNRLHIFTNTGLPIIIIALEGKCITMIGNETQLFIVYCNNHKFQLFDVEQQKLLAKGFLPLKSLIWAGFDLEKHSILIESGNYIMMSLCYENGVRWISVLDIKKYFERKTSSFFTVEVDNNNVYGVMLENNIKSPSVNPLPKLNEYKLQPLTFQHHQSKCMLSLLNYEQAENKDKAARALDRELVILFSNALADNKLLLATQIFKRLKTQKGKEIALRYADQKGHRIVSERILKIMEENVSDEETDVLSDEESSEPPPFIRIQKISEEEEYEEEEINEPIKERSYSEQSNSVQSNSNEEQNKIVEENDENDEYDSGHPKNVKKKGAPTTGKKKNVKRRPAMERIKKPSDVAALDRFGFS